MYPRCFFFWFNTYNLSYFFFFYFLFIVDVVISHTVVGLKSPMEEAYRTLGNAIHLLAYMHRILQKLNQRDSKQAPAEFIFVLTSDRISYADLRSKWFADMYDMFDNDEDRLSRCCFVLYEKVIATISPILEDWKRDESSPRTMNEQFHLLNATHIPECVTYVLQLEVTNATISKELTCFAEFVFFACFAGCRLSWDQAAEKAFEYIADTNSSFKTCNGYEGRKRTVRVPALVHSSYGVLERGRIYVGDLETTKI